MDLTAAECNMQLKDLLSPPWLVSLLPVSTPFDHLYLFPVFSPILANHLDLPFLDTGCGARH